MTVILGIDPGSRITGYGLIRENSGTIDYIDSGCIRTRPDQELSARLLEIYNGVCLIMDRYAPDEVAIEQVFMHENPNAALKLGHARGVAMVAAASHRIKLYEYSPREIKQTVVGYGGAEKAQVNHMVVHLLALSSSPQTDAADALAIAICHSHRRRAVPLMVKRHRTLKRRVR